MLPKLLEGEEIDFQDMSEGAREKPPEEEINDKYVRGDIRIVTEQARYPLNTIMTMLDSGDYELNPEFQRRHRWTRLKQSRLIESFIMNVPIPPIFLYEVSYSEYEVMDGLQRLTAIGEFYRGNYRLEDLQEWHELNGYDYESLPEQVRRGIDRRYLSSIILLQETAKSDEQAQALKQLVFERINSGGDKLEPQESRNALYNGKLNQLCMKLAATVSFCKMWGIPTEDEPVQDQNDIDDEIPAATDYKIALANNPLYRKMQDVELVLRFFAHRQIADVEQGRLRDFLDVFLKKGNLFPRDLLRQYEELFVSTSDLVFELFGESAFYLYRPRKGLGWGWFERPTKVVYDALMFAVSQHLSDRNVLMTRNREEWLAELKEFYKQNHEMFAGRSTNKQDILSRRELMLEFFDSRLS